MTEEVQIDCFGRQRQNMVKRQLRDRGIKGERVLQAMARVPRHFFVPDQLRDCAYEDNALPIGEDQTISQPYIVGAMLDAVAIEPSSIVLEIGTGSGYLTALLAELAHQVYSVERLSGHARSAEAALAASNYHNVTIEVGDGSLGLQQFAPYDAVVVSAAAPQVPAALFGQLREGGRMVVPIGTAQAQDLLLVTKHNGTSVNRKLFACRFVPLIGEQGYKTNWQNG